MRAPKKPAVDANGALSSQTIFRNASRDKPYTAICNAVLRDLNLSPEATGILVFILSYPKDWRFNLEWLQKARGISKRLAQRVIREHMAAGYCQRRQLRTQYGTHGPCEYLFTDEPWRDAAANISPQHQNGVTVHEPQHQKPQTVNEPLQSNEGRDKEKEATNK